MYNSVMNCFKKCFNLKELECLYASMIKNNAVQDCFYMNQFITTCSTFRRTDYAVRAFTEMESPNAYVYNAIIKAFIHCLNPVQALHFYLSMLRAGVSPSSYTFPSVIKGCVLVSDLGFGESVHGQIFRFGFGSNVFVQTSLIDFYSGFGRLVGARQVFDEIPERDGFVWTTMLSGYSRGGDMGSARRLFDEMPERNVATWNSLINGYARVRDMGSCELLFREMPEKDLISWTTMISCYSQNKLYSEALTVFSEMRMNGVRPDEVTMTTVISSCAHLGALDLGKDIHLYVMQNGFELDVYIGSALIDMYAKCGSLERALVVFFKLQEKNLFCWNSIIEGLAVHGLAEEAISMFGRMEKDNIKPNGVTFISVLSACTHAGLVEVGRRWFKKMTHELSITPQIEHYGCMVDLLCKAGLFEDALELIQSMTMEPNAIIWGAVLGGSKLYKNLDIAQVAANMLMVLEPNNSGYYSLLVSMHADANRWNEVAKTRSAMKELGVEKSCPGSSWIEMESKIHQFAASDKCHPAASQIYSLLHELENQLKLYGHVLEFKFFT